MRIMKKHWANYIIIIIIIYCTYCTSVGENLVALNLLYNNGFEYLECVLTYCLQAAARRSLMESAPFI